MSSRRKNNGIISKLVSSYLHRRMIKINQRSGKSFSRFVHHVHSRRYSLSLSEYRFFLCRCQTIYFLQIFPASHFFLVDITGSLGFTFCFSSRRVCFSIKKSIRKICCKRKSLCNKNIIVFINCIMPFCVAENLVKY